MIHTQVVEQYHQQLKTVKDWDELSKLLEVASFDHNLSLVSRRRGVPIYITAHTHDNRISYLYDDGVNSGNCAITNLHKYFKFN